MQVERDKPLECCITKKKYGIVTENIALRGQMIEHITIVDLVNVKDNDNE